MGDELFLTLHCAADEQMPIALAYDIATLVEDRIRRACSDVAGMSVHVEPAEADAPS